MQKTISQSLAGRVGYFQLLPFNLEELHNQASFDNEDEIVVKRPKLYFYDTSIVCSLMGIRKTEHLRGHPIRGAIFENFVVSEIIKQYTHRGLPIDLYYWRDRTGHEVDLIAEEAFKLFSIEIKSGKTLNNEFFNNLNYWMALSGVKKGMRIYAGDFEQIKSNGIIVKNWKSLSHLLKFPVE